MSEPLDEIASFLRAKFGRPSPEVERVIVAFAALGGGTVTAPASEPAPATVPDDLVARLAAIEVDIAALKSASPVSADEPSVSDRLDAIDRAMVAIQGAVSKLEAVPHLVAQPARAAAPARASVPAAKPAA